MTIYNNDDWQPLTGKRIKSDGTVVNEADGLESDGKQDVVTSGRTTSYQRVMVNQTIASNGSVSMVLNVGLGTKAINLAFKSSASAYIGIYGSDANGSTFGNNSLATSLTSGGVTGNAIISEYGGAPYITIYAFDKSGAANTIQYIDAYWTKG